ncbi:hypothetical protein IT575_11360 [bacterium]|nr:hypothetical protein [bacterium]
MRRFTAPLAALLLLLALAASCSPAPLPPPRGSVSISGTWDWDVRYEDGERVTFTMRLFEIAPDEYRASVDGDDVGTAFMDGRYFTWIWNRPTGVSRADGTHYEWGTFNGDYIEGSGFDTFDNGKPRADFVFTARQR